MCRAARDARFGTGYMEKISRAIDMLSAFESQVFAQIEAIIDANIEIKLYGKRLSKAISKAKVESRRQAISHMCAKQPSSESFIDHSCEIGQAFSGQALQMCLACYGCQGIFGYLNVRKEASPAEQGSNLNRWRRSSNDFDHRCAEAATSLQCKGNSSREAPREPYHDSLPYLQSGCH